VLSHPWHDCSPPPLDAVLEPVTSPSTYYIHDLALLPETRGSGAGAAIVGILAARARTLQLPNMTLVAVNNSVHFWQRQGFTVTHDPALDAKLASYGDQAHFMTRDLT
jgi:N-acetylglutamate synthase-like GNAT family acetyltransferase